MSHLMDRLSDRNGLKDESTGLLIKSETSAKRAHIAFVNKSGHTVTIFWLDFAGSLVKYASLDDGKIFKVKTFVGHPWIARSETHAEEMQFYYKSSTATEASACGSSRSSSNEAEFNRILWPPFSPKKLVPALILLPVFTLKKVCLRKLQVLVAESGLTYDSAQQLRLPRSLFDDLVDTARLKAPELDVLPVNSSNDQDV